MGWVSAARDTRTGELRFDVVESARDLVALFPSGSILCIDIPIGLPDGGGRECDRLARSLLGWPRCGSVFPAPVRAALRARSREEASRITERIDGRRVGAQAWALYGKIREVDEVLRAPRQAGLRVHEVHPEVSFTAWNGERIRDSKKTEAGRRIRERLVEAWLGSGVASRARGGRVRHEVEDDDVLDAIAALWTAMRMETGHARCLPPCPPRDATGLRMEIAY